MKKLFLLGLFILSTTLNAQSDYSPSPSPNPDDPNGAALNQMERVDGEGMYEEDRQAQEEDEYRFDEGENSESSSESSDESGVNW